jgi:hypothetical protein
LNRLGFIEEVVVEQMNRPVESTYFGFITCSNETSLRQATTSIAKKNGEEELPYEASVATAGGSALTYRKYLLSLPSSYSYSECASLIAKVKEALAAGDLKPARADHGASQPGHSLRTFLYTVRAAMQSRNGNYSETFVFNGTQFQLQTSKEPDRKTAAQLAAKGLVRPSEEVLRLTGTIRNLSTRSATTFRLWHRAGEELPLRFEYKAKSFLDLVFETEPDRLRARSG